MTNFSSRSWVSECSAITTSFILSFMNVPCAVAWGQDGWQKIENESFSFSVPSSFKKTGVHGIDSFIEEYVTERIELSFDYGIYSNNFFGWPKDTKFEYLKVNGKDARIGTAMREFHKEFSYSTQIYIKLDGWWRAIIWPSGMALSMFAACKSQEDVELAKDIFKTISFNEKRPGHLFVPPQ